LVLLCALDLLGGCAITLGFGATKTTSGDARGLAPTVELGVGFAWDFDRVFVQAGPGGHLLAFDSETMPDARVAQTLRYNARLDLTLAKKPFLRSPANLVARGTAMVWWGGCVVEVDMRESDCGGGRNYVAFTGLTGGFSAPHGGNLTLSAGPTFWRASSKDYGVVRGIGGKVFLTYHVTRISRSGSRFFVRDSSRRMGSKLEYNIEMKRYRERMRKYRACRARGSAHCGSRPRRPRRP
jgi:hypothetical protein